MRTRTTAAQGSDLAKHCCWIDYLDRLQKIAREVELVCFSDLRVSLDSNFALNLMYKNE